ncbi:MAG TPA: 4Fe-4S dicluster domain-containing protein [bacterium]|nr:4Fe-4S dicluster domain-containing protein [bacterium]HPG46208.1 4Fe-4S dicluster domain-containing protein [bacterium]HPM98598.1 4Fe-4S dicluster domain-containing protein [bacterium]
MAHHTLKSGYACLTERLNRFPQGAPPSERLFQILQMLFSEKDAELVALLPIKPFTAQKAATIWKKTLVEAEKILQQLASRAILVDVEQDGKSLYCLPPPMAGFFEFSLMRVRGDIDQRLLSELFYQYITVEEDFIKALFADGETQLGRAFVHEPVLSGENALHVLDYDRASQVIESASHFAVGLCYCRHKKEHLGMACAAPLDICMTFGGTAFSLVKHGYARAVDAKEGIDLLQQAYDHKLVQFGENVRQGVSFICNCCGCCCEAMIAQRRFGSLQPIHTTSFIPRIDSQACNGCGKCVFVCPVEAMALVSANDPQRPKAQVARLNESQCLGCGICVRECNRSALKLSLRAQRILTPLDTTHRVVLMAIERGKLAELIFDNRVLWSHRALAALLGVILKLPPLKQALASRQIKSQYLEKLIASRQKR